MIVKAFEGQLSPQGLKIVAEALRRGGLIIYPTDTTYSIGCDALQIKALEHLAEIKGISLSKSNITILCSDIAQASTYARIDDEVFSFLKANTPGPYTFVLPPSSGLPRIYRGRKEVGIRIPRHRLPISLIDYYGSPLAGLSLPQAPRCVDDVAYTYHPELIHELWEQQVDVVVDGGICDSPPSTIINCTQKPYSILREGGQLPTF